MTTNWTNENLWVLKNERPLFAAAPPYVGNGCMGLRLGSLVLGTDTEALQVNGFGCEQTRWQTASGDHTFPLQFFTAFARDESQYCLPSWANINLRVGKNEFRPGQIRTSSTDPLTSSLDLRTGESKLTGTWRVGQKPVRVTIRLLIPRSVPHAGCWQLELEGMPEETELEFGFFGKQPFAVSTDSEQCLFSTVTTQTRGFKIYSGINWSCEGVDSLRVEGGKVIAKTESARLHVRVAFACHGGTESGSVNDVKKDLDLVNAGLEDGSLFTENEACWRQIWNRAPDVTDLPVSEEEQQMLLAQMFYLLSSYDGSDHAVGPLGLSGNKWDGNHLWDTDLWHFQGLNTLWPELARQSIKARIKMLPGAREHAEKTGFKGARFGWMCDIEGRETAPGDYSEELHVNIWIMLSVWENYLNTRDVDFLRESWSLMKEVADFWVSRTVEQEDGKLHITGVVGPDEYITENPDNPGLVDDHFTTNVGVKEAVSAAIKAAEILGEEFSPGWMELTEKLYIPGPDAKGVIPEYKDYNGHLIKQGDVVLGFYPLNVPVEQTVVKANLDYYSERCIWGPLMGEQISSAIRLRHAIGDRETVLKNLLRFYSRFCRGVFHVPYESIDNTNSVFLTGCGGLISAIVRGWWDYRNPGDESSLIPRL